MPEAALEIRFPLGAGVLLQIKLFQDFFSFTGRCPADPRQKPQLQPRPPPR